AVDWKPISVKNGKRSIKTGMKKLGAFLGDGVIVGAGNTLQPGMVVPPGKILPACYTVSQK
ncbi:MAG: GlmU protein, partial [Nitrospinaceae bacterium]